MVKISRNFIAGKMNKSVDERLLPNGQYVDAMNVRLGSTEESEIGSVENAKGNEVLTQIKFGSTALSNQAKCIGAYEDGANETIYWFVHDPAFAASPNTNKLDMIVSYNTTTGILKNHVISVRKDGQYVNTTLNFSEDYLITGVEKVEDLLFFTDNLNPPRQINVRRNYPNPAAGKDSFSEESILVVKKPPFNSPGIQPISTLSQDNFLEDRFICFAYRYKYADGEYSATSQFSKPSFTPSTFRYNLATGLNDGMINTTNECVVTYNSGGPLVKSIDLLFKDMESSVIKVIEEINKSDLGLADNTDYTFTFNNSKIFTVLPDSEILRLYDNVPRTAQAQTLMGNRLMYGNYIEGYDLKDSNNVPTKFEYTTTLKEEEIDFTDLNDSVQRSTGTYTIGSSSQSINDSIISIDLAGLTLKAGAAIGITLIFEHAAENNSPGAETTQETTISFSYNLPQNFSSVYELASSADFQARIGTSASIQTVALSCDGTTLTDVFNCSIPNNLNNFIKYKSGITDVDQPIAITTTPASTSIGLQIPAMQFVDDVTTPTAFFEEYYEITGFDIEFQEIGDTASLHSNRGYEVGIIYMDEYKRSSTALVSPNNTVHVPCSSSTTKNSIRVTIPPQQVAPYWAKSYKFAIKPDKKDYDTIFSNIFFTDPQTGYAYFLLDGQNSTKIEEGDELIVKRDTQGSRGNCTWATVLEKEARLADFIPDLDDNVYVPAGTYMKLLPNNFNTTLEDNAYISYGDLTSKGENCRTINYPVTLTSTGTVNYDLPAGSRIRIRIENKRDGKNGVSYKYWFVDSEFTVPKDYNNFKEWFDDNNIDVALESQAVTDGVDGPNYSETDTSRPCSCCNIYTNFNTAGTRFVVKSSEGHGRSSRKNTRISVLIEVVRAVSEIVFESNPQDAEPDLWYESSTCYEVDSNGHHQGNIQDQTASASGIVDTDFFNCYSFGNGVESYKIEDSLKGKQLALGNRATTTEAKLYGEERRLSDITYSGVYNAESNVNKLNEFNLGLANFKPLEQSFGPLRKMVARETDILSLQEDKISYVLAGKNLLSDASGGSALTSIPEVLGTQVARIENFGISNNPESFAQWGSNKFFTDAKRGAVIQLKGSSAQNEQLTVISEFGMRSWFRDLFIRDFNTQKLGGYDPYMNEYVLSSNNSQLPADVVCEECGITDLIPVKDSVVFEKCYNLGEFVGDARVSWQATWTGSTTGITPQYTISFTYGGTTTPLTKYSESGQIKFIDKDLILDEELQVSVTSNIDLDLTITVGCPDPDEINIVLVQVSNDGDVDEQITNQYRWTNAEGFISPLHSETVVFGSGNFPVVSLFTTIAGLQGGGIVPTDGATVTMLSNKLSNDTFNFNINSDNFRYLRSDTVYGNNTSDIQALLAASSEANPIIAPGVGETAYSADFPMPNTGSNLYLIWDYTDSTQVDLCAGAEPYDACCDC
jgi:hypothetical protein